MMVFLPLPLLRKYIRKTFAESLTTGVKNILLDVISFSITAINYMNGRPEIAARYRSPGVSEPKAPVSGIETDRRTLRSNRAFNNMNEQFAYRILRSRSYESGLDEKIPATSGDRRRDGTVDRTARPEKRFSRSSDIGRVWRDSFRTTSTEGRSMSDGDGFLDAVCSMQRYLVWIFTLAIALVIVQLPYLFIVEFGSSLFVVASMNVVGFSLFAIGSGMTLRVCDRRG